LDTSTLHDLLLRIGPEIRSTANFIEEAFGEVGVGQASAKSLNSLVSYVDVESEKRLVEVLSKALPEAGFVTEEDTIDNNVEADLQWVIDPLDGTTNFLKGIPVFCISLGLVKNGHPVLGVVHDVMRNDHYTAVKGGGAYLDGKRLRISGVKDFDQAVLATGFPYETYEEDSPMFKLFQRVIREARGLRRLGSAAIDLAYVARGIFEGYYEARLNSWDIAAGALLVEEAGGRITDFQGKNGYLSAGSIIAGGNEIHAELLQRITETGAYVY
jgi:myo-inositol-1(or 4)-monophosphatase